MVILSLFIFLIFIIKSSQNEHTYYVNQNINNIFQNGTLEYPYRFLDFLNNNETQINITTIFLSSEYNENKILDFTIYYEVRLLGIENATFKNDQKTIFEIKNGMLKIENINFYSCVIINQNGGEVFLNVLFFLKSLFLHFFRM